MSGGVVRTAAHLTLADQIAAKNSGPILAGLETAWTNGYRAGLAHAETALYQGEEVLFALLRQGSSDDPG